MENTQSYEYLPDADETRKGVVGVATRAQALANTKNDPNTGARLVVPADQYMSFPHDSTATVQTHADSIGRIPITITGIGTAYIRYFNT